MKFLFIDQISILVGDSLLFSNQVGVKRHSTLLAIFALLSLLRVCIKIQWNPVDTDTDGTCYSVRNKHFNFIEDI